MRRREFMGSLAASVALASTAGLSGCAGSSSIGRYGASSEGVVSDHRRKQLVALAEFGRKRPASGRRGIAVSTVRFTIPTAAIAREERAV